MTENKQVWFGVIDGDDTNRLISALSKQFKIKIEPAVPDSAWAVCQPDAVCIAFYARDGMETAGAI